ncbi:hypothetical protein GHT06_003851 [Daphnia sinensis]|uniref:Uncharacterized protein n=1 Tax=Daphnia sinensis TaxID=1820382 RepID=A0AAD5KUB2_9CRUS|nr:hypothetical protein GHT06_003851 [Daphnia sinensis]
MEAMIVPQYDTKAILNQLCACYGSESFDNWCAQPFVFKVMTTTELKLAAERRGEADIPLADFIGSRWTPRYEGDWDNMPVEPLLLARLLYGNNSWAWRELADERDPKNQWRWPYHSCLHMLMAPRDVVLPERLFITLRHVLHDHPRAAYVVPQAKAHWKPFLTVPSFSLEVPSALKNVLGIAGLHKSSPATANLPPLARFHDGRDQIPTKPGTAPFHAKAMMSRF